MGACSHEPLRAAAEWRYVFPHIELLNRVDISGVEPTAHASPVFNVVREDVPVDGLERKAVLDLAPRSANQLVILPKVIE
jgi:aspartyl-tRNA(Asn)/glutamyl-tRNA(Gln) amidotransferase subunit C